LGPLPLEHRSALVYRKFSIIQ